jgi:transcriptional regulator with XRE-family HTH domain
MSDVASLVREARREAGLSMRALARRADVSFTTINRIEHDQLDPTFSTVEKLLSAIGQELELSRRKAKPVPHLTDLTDAWSTDDTGQDQPDWTRLRAFTDHLARHPEIAQAAIVATPDLSGSTFFDTLLAGLAEKIADDSRFTRPAWTKRVPPLDHPWISFGTPRMQAADRAATPPPLAERNLFIPSASLFRPGPEVEAA